MGTGTELGRVRGLGSAKSGVGHWWHQRVTAIGNLALMLWFVFSLVRLPALDYPTVILWLRQPVAAIPMLLLIVSVFYHFRLGVQVFIEDYLHEEGGKLAALLALNFYALGGAAAAVFCVFKIALGA
ncbi:MAG: succinate dehydrogenase, hydrophobic membrane anchor protein [Sphingomonadaceae bacterium]|nr:succinate dehydrogenase, hydrophobic membrane anchor protein [Sphingomonadaceae bacterium]